MGVKIHPTAIVAKEALLGADVEIGAYSIVGAKVKLGDRVVLAPHVVIEGNTQIGSDSRLFQFASIGSAPQDLKFTGEDSTLIIGERNTIREYVTLQPGTARGHMTTKIGSDNLFMANSHVGHDCVVGSSNILANSVALAGHVTVGSHVTLGGLAAVHQFCTIGDFAFLGGGAMICDDIPPYCFGQGDRCRLRGINVIGLERAGFSAEDIKAVRKTYRYFFASPGQFPQRLESFPPELVEIPAVRKFVDFIRGSLNSKRGICFPAQYYSRGVSAS